MRREGAELQSSAQELEANLDADISRRERRLNETPMEAMERIQAEIDDDSSFTALEDKIGQAQARADAMADLNAAEAAADEADDDVLDLDSTEVEPGSEP